MNRVTSIVTYFSEAISVNNSSIFGGGASAESDEALRERIAESYYNPSMVITRNITDELP